MLAAAMLLVATCCACSTSDPPRSGDGSTGKAALEVELASGTQGLDDQERSAVQDSIGDVLSAYLVDGFLGTYPREDFVKVARRLHGRGGAGGRPGPDLLTASRFAESDGVRPKKLHATVSCLTVAGEVVAATAHVDFAFEALDGKAAPRPVTLRGRFMLEKDGKKWSIPGYDVLRDDAERVGS